MSRLCYHVNALTPSAKGTLLASPTGALKLLNTALDVRFLDDEYLPLRPDARFVYREVFEDGYSEGDVLGRVDRLCRNGAPLLKYGRRVIWETPWNEQMQSYALLGLYCERTMQAIDVMRSRGYEVVTVGHFSVQWPEVHARELFLPAIRAADYLDLHTYSAPNVADDWERNVGHAVETAGWAWDVAQKQTYFGEFGIDFGVLGMRLSGWRTQGMPAYVYRGQLRDVARSLPRYVMAAFVFCCGQFGDWASFDVAGEHEIEQLMREEYPVPSFILGFKELSDLMRARGLDPGEPLENEQPRVFEDDWIITRQRTSTGVMLWIKDLNCPAFAFRDRRLVSWDGTTLRVA